MVWNLCGHFCESPGYWEDCFDKTTSDYEVDQHIWLHVPAE